MSWGLNTEIYMGCIFSQLSSFLRTQATIERSEAQTWNDHSASLFWVGSTQIWSIPSGTGIRIGSRTQDTRASALASIDCVHWVSGSVVRESTCIFSQSHNYPWNGCCACVFHTRYGAIGRSSNLPKTSNICKITSGWYRITNLASVVHTPSSIILHSSSL